MCGVSRIVPTAIVPIPCGRDGCDACMCFNHGNAAWCDGFRNEYYDTYFDQHGRNPWGDTIRANRKCNTEFRPFTSKCDAAWHCAKGYACYELSAGEGGGGANCSQKICISSGRRWRKWWLIEITALSVTTEEDKQENVSSWQNQIYFDSTKRIKLADTEYKITSQYELLLLLLLWLFLLLLVPYP